MIIKLIEPIIGVLVVFLLTTFMLIIFDDRRTSRSRHGLGLTTFGAICIVGLACGISIIVYLVAALVWPHQVQ